MKISKIFHWLYAFLMSLPIVATLTTSLYVVFNPNAMESTSITETQYRKVEYQTNEVSSFDDLVIGNVYSFYFVNPNYQGDTFSSYFGGFPHYYNILNIVAEDISNFEFFIYNGYSGETDFSLIYTPYYSTNFSYLFYFIPTYHYTNVSNPFTDLINYEYEFDGSGAINYSTPLIFNIVLTETLLNDLQILGSNEDYFDNQFIRICDLSQIPIQYEEIETTTLDNAFSWAVNSINDNPLFSWASASFLVQPFHYIGNVFGLPMTSPINTLLSYWLDISIIWLVFDLIMYLPLLAHRWLDKGVLE